MTWIDKFKFNVFNTFRQVGLVGILIDPKVSGVVVPEPLQGSPRILLHVGDKLTDGSALPVPIRDLDVNLEDGVKVTLSFNLSPSRVSFPWSAVIAIGIVGSDVFCQFHGSPVSHEPPKTVSENVEEAGTVIPFPTGRLKN